MEYVLFRYNNNYTQTTASLGRFLSREAKQVGCVRADRATIVCWVKRTVCICEEHAGCSTILLPPVFRTCMGPSTLVLVGRISHCLCVCVCGEVKSECVC